MGAMPGNKAWHLYKRGLGPTPDQLFMQSNFGIVTKMGVWLMPEPESVHAAVAACLERRRPRAVVDTLRTLMLDGTIAHGPADHEHACCWPSVLAERAKQWDDGDGPIPEDDPRQDGRELEIGRWMMRFALYGDEAVVDHRFAKVKDAFERIPGAEVWGTKYAPEQSRHREPDRARAGRRAEPRPERDDRLVRRRAGRPHRLLAGRPADRPGRARRCATCCAG